jgi:hypothetical protein
MTHAAAPHSLVGASPRARSGGLARREVRAGDTLLCFLLLVYLVSLMLEGPLRYGLARSGFPDALYLRDAIPVGTLAFLFLRSLFADRMIEPLIAIPVGLLMVHGALAAMFGVSFFSILFGFKIFMFLPYGMAMWPLIRQRLDAALTAASIMFVVTLTGVALNFVLERMPWEAFEYDTAFGTLTTTRLWWIPGGISRLPGFTRTSFNAAMILGITGMLTMVKLRSLVPRAAVAAAALTAIVATTSKGMMLAFPLAAIWLLVPGQRAHALAGRVMVYVVGAFTLLLPPVMVLFDLGSGMAASQFPQQLVSAWERFTMMWPLAFELLPSGPAALLGAGLGSIGTPQLYGDAPHLLNAADSLSVFLIVNFGALGALYYIAPALALHRLASREDLLTQRACIGLLLIAYGYGISISMIEESFFAISFGLCLGAVVTALLNTRVVPPR